MFIKRIAYQASWQKVECDLKVVIAK